MQTLLSKRGRCYLLVLEENKPKDIIRILRTHGCISKVFMLPTVCYP